MDKKVLDIYKEINLKNILIQITINVKKVAKYDFCKLSFMRDGTNKRDLTALRTFGAPQCICIAKSRLHVNADYVKNI